MVVVDFVSDLKPFKSMWKVRVKIVRMWKQYSGAVGETIEMVLVDSKVLSKLMVNFSVAQSTGSYRTTSHPYHVVFPSTTRVQVCENLPLQWSCLSLVPFKAIMDGTQDPDYLVDVIGQIVEVTQIEVVSVNEKDTEKLALELCNHALSNAYNVSDVALDPDMIVVEDFRVVLPKDDLTTAILESKPLAPVNGVSEKDDFFIHTPRKTIAEVLASRQINNNPKMVGKCIVICKTCSKKVLTVPTDYIDDGIDGNVFAHTYFFVKCNSYAPTLLPRYKLHVVVLGNSRNTKFLLFDNLALQLLHQQCIELTGPITNEPTFKVLKIITNSDMITEFVVTHSLMGSMMVRGSFSRPSVSKVQTPAKRIGAPIINLEADFDKNSVTRMSCPVKIKNQKLYESG
ncbi:hypothetical protein N665_0274s0002 [Sinapis alba]|nr:hypothetical protein N665_0274s0002 [Sinapis alba]